MKSLVISLIAGITFVLLSSTDLPPLVASNFGKGGMANGFMQRDTYLMVMLALISVLPLAMVLPVQLMKRTPANLINIPHRDYWLAPDRRKETLSYVSRHMAIFSVALILFLCFVHWLVVGANTMQPPRLSEPPFITGLLLFFGFVLAWIGILLRHFRLRP